MIRFIIFFALLAMFTNAFGMLTLSGNKEVDFPLTSLGHTSKILFSILNSSSTESAINISPSLVGADYSFVGGSYPGVGGNCASTLTPNSSCLLAVEFTPTSIGDRDSDLSLIYDIGAEVGSHLKIRLDGHSMVIGSGADCSAITPSVSEINSSLAEINDNAHIVLKGSNFTPVTTVTVLGLQTSNIHFHSPKEISFDLATSSDIKKYKMIVSNECNSLEIPDAIDVRATLWVDLRISANVSMVNPVYDTSRISSYTVDPNYGIQLTGIIGNDWRKGLKFSGYCAPVNKDFDIVVYRTARSKRSVFSLFNEDTQVSPSLGNNYHIRPYIGFWNYGTRVARVYGSQYNEVGGVNWNQSFSYIDTLAGKFIRYHFQHAGQNGYNLEIWEVDSNFNNITLLRTVSSTKTQTPAARVCPGLTPYTSGDADYFITGLRIK